MQHKPLEGETNMAWNEHNCALAIAIDNEQHLLNHALQVCAGWKQDVDAGDALCRWLVEQVERRGPIFAPVDALILAAIREVDWREMGRHYHEKIREGALGGPSTMSKSR